MNKKILSIFVLVLVLSFNTQANASLTFTTDAITGTSASTIDLGTGNDLFLQTSGGKVGIGTITPGAVLDIDAGSTYSGDKISNLSGTFTGLTGIASKYGNYSNITFTGTASAGGSLQYGSYLKVNNNFEISTYTPNIVGQYILIDGISNTGNQYGGWFNSTSVSNSANRAVYGIATSSHTTGTKVDNTGIYGRATINGVGGTTTDSSGVFGLALSTGATTSTNHAGVYGHGYVTAGTISKLYSFRAATTIGGGTITDAYGLYVPVISKTGGTVTTAYGAYLSTPTAGTTNYPLYVAGSGTSYFAGKIRAPGIPAYANNAAALAGGLVAGDLYYTDTAGEYVVKIAH